MSESNRMCGDSSLKLPDISREEGADCHISNKIRLSNPLDGGSETNGYNRDSRGGKNEEHDYRNQMIDLPKLLRQLSLARVVLKRLPISTEATKLRITEDQASVDVVVADQGMDSNAPRNEHVPPSEYIDYDGESHADSVAIGYTCDTVGDVEQKYKMTTTCEGQKPADLIKRNCPKCKITVADASVCRKQSCAKCEAPLDFQCARCAKQYNNYKSLCSHLNTICSTENLDLKCPECDYRAASKLIMRRHQGYCLSGIIYNCKHCNFTTKHKSNLRRHLQNKHEDYDVILPANSAGSGNDCGIAAETEKNFLDKSTTTCNREKPADLIKRYCPRCKKFKAVARITVEQSCTTCGTPLDFQCARCGKQYSNYESLVSHLDRKCNSQNLDLKCLKCDYRTHAKTLMSWHIHRCLSGLDFSCSLCEYTTKLKANLLRHMIIIHKDILKVDCSRCKTKSNKCGQCKNRVLICETCHTGFSSTDRFQKHQKSCKQPVLGCEYCPYKTHVNNELREHIRLEHLSALMSQTLPLRA